MRRREFIASGLCSVAWPRAAGAQQAGNTVIGFLHSGSPAAYAHLAAAFHQGLKQTGYFEGQNLAVEYRWAEGQFDRLPMLAADLVGRKVALIAALGGSAPPMAVQKATASIPILFSSGEVDPVKSGLVASLNRPGGNVTGVSPMTSALIGKRLSLLQELVPNVAEIGYLTNPRNPNTESARRDVQTAAGELGLRLHPQDAGTEGEIDAAFASFAKRGVGALFVGGDAFYFTQRNQIVALAARHALPASYYTREFVTAGGLTSYVASFADAYRQTGIYAGRILKGEKPADLPVVQSIKFELAINLKAAKELGLSVPAKLLFTADEVIE